MNPLTVRRIAQVISISFSLPILLLINIEATFKNEICSFLLGIQLISVIYFILIPESNSMPNAESVKDTMSDKVTRKIVIIETHERAMKIMRFLVKQEIDFEIEKIKVPEDDE